MNIFFFLASLLLFVLGIGHTVLGEWLGERVLVAKSAGFEYFPDDKAKDVLAKQIIRIAWHATSITWCGLGGVVLYASFLPLTSEVRTVMVIVAGTMIAISLFASIVVKFRNTKGLLFLVTGIVLIAGAVAG